jgi:putative peptide modification target (TIGR04139 family)
MKKLTGMKKNFSSLENKKLSNMASIIGGGESNTKWTTDSCGEGSPGQADIKYWTDGKLTKREELVDVSC